MRLLGKDLLNIKFNKNKSYSFNMTIGTSLTQLSGFTASEVLINNKSGQVVNIFDNERNGADQAFQLADSDSMVLRDRLEIY